MKSLFRSNLVQGTLGFLVWGYMELVLKTIRWQRLNEAMVEAHMATPQGAIGCFWHGDIGLAIAAKPVVRNKQTRILISLSPDGEFVSRAMVKHDMPAIRGSSSKKGAKAKGGASAFREALGWLKDGGVLVVTPDGPRGPPEEMAAGVVKLARITGAPVFLMGLAARPVLKLNNWDRTKLPRPFGRGAILWDGPFIAPPGADEAQMEALAKDWSARLTDACARAQAAIA